MPEEVKRPRGRPRPDETVERDEMILAALRELGPQTRNTLAERFSLPVTQVYLSLDRLRRRGEVRICADTNGPGSVWTAGEACL